MTRTTIRLALLVVAAGVLLGAMSGCFFGGDEEPEPTVDIQATIAAAVEAAKPTATPTPEPTATSEPTVPPTPDIAQTIAAAIAAMRPTDAPAPTAAPPPTAAPAVPTPVQPTTPTPQVTNTPTPAPEQSGGPPCVVTGKVRSGGIDAKPGTNIFARSKTSNDFFETQTDDMGRYVLTITAFDQIFDLFVEGRDSGVDTPKTQRGCREIRNLSVN